MASAPPDPLPMLVSLKAVAPAEYPYYGTADLEPAMSLQQALDGDSAVVAEEFLIRLNAHVGQFAAPGRKRLSESPPCSSRSRTACSSMAAWGRA